LIFFENWGSIKYRDGADFSPSGRMILKTSYIVKTTFIKDIFFVNIFVISFFWGFRLISYIIVIG
jgi:hypothetical protein